LPLAVSSAVWFSCKRLRWLPLKSPVEPSLEFCLRLESLRVNLAAQPQPAGSSLGLLLPTAHQEPKVHMTRARPPALFRLQGLATLLTAYSLQFRAGFISHRPRSWDSPFGAFSSRKASGALTPGRTHLPFSLSVFPPPKRKAGPTGRSSWVSSFRESLAIRQGFSLASRWMLPWVLCTGSIPSVQAKWLTGLCVHLASRRSLLPTARCSLANPFALPQPSGTDLAVPSIRANTSRPESVFEILNQAQHIVNEL
jgi:hypothetical protein